MPVRPAAFARGVEIDDVQAGGPGRDEGHGLLERIAVDGLGGELSAEQAHALAGSDIDGGPQLQGHTPEGSSAQIRAKRSSSCRPADADFSGWNCVPNMSPRSNATAISPP